MRSFAFLRAVNVGGRTVRNERLRAIFEDLGFEGVATFIASGNVVFDDDGGSDRAALESRIEAGLQQGLGFEVATFVRTGGELEAVLHHHAFDDAAVPAGEGSTYVGFLRRAPTAEGRAKAEAMQSDTDAVRVHGNEIYWRVIGLSQDSAVSGAVLEKVLDMPLTLRNVNTVRRLVEKFGAD